MLAFGNITEDQSYWSLRSSTGQRNSPIGEVNALDQLDLLLPQCNAPAHDRRRSAGAFLSGGVDSSTVVALMQSQRARP